MTDRKSELSVEARLFYSEQRLRLAQAAAEIGTWEWDPDSEAASWTEEAHKIYDIPISEPHLHRTWRTKVHPSDYDAMDQSTRECAATGSMEVEYRYYHSERGLIWIATKARMTPGADGRRLMYGVAVDVTERKRREIMLTVKSEASAMMSGALEAEHILNQLPAIMVPRVADFCTMYLMDNDESAGTLTSFKIGLHHADRAQETILRKLTEYAVIAGPAAPIPTVMRTGAPLLVEEIILTKFEHNAVDEEHRRLRRELGNTSLMTLPLTARGRTFGIISLGLTESGNFPGRRFDQADLDWVAELASHTAVALENARLYREAQEALAGLREADRQKNEFLAMLGHELRNPLMPLRNALELLAINGSDGREFNRLREMMNRQLGNLTRIIDELLDIARVVHGKLKLEKSWIPVSDVLARAVELADEQLRTRGHKLYVRNPPEMLMIEGDAGRLAQAVANLLSNAAKYTDPAGKIELSGELEGEEAVIRVRDNGAGIAAEFLPAVFDLFSQAESSLDRSQGGLGIGLALVKRLVEMHGGRVSAHSAGLGRGSEFLIRLPARYAGIADHNARVDSDGLRTTAPAQRRIMVVDDNRDAAETLAMLLQIYGHQVSTVHDGLEAIGKAREFAPEVALLDLGLPGLDGYKLACQLRDSPPTANAVLIAVSGYGQPEDRRRSQEAGFDDHLLKPVDPAWLNGRIAELFAKRSAISSK